MHASKPKSPPKLKKLYHGLPKTKFFLYFAFLTGLIAIIWWIIIAYYGPSQLSKADYYKSLDLSQARQAKYANKPISLIKDFGQEQGVHEELISFNVPKDGLSEYGLMTLPGYRASKTGYPVIILCHGYAYSERYNTLNNYLADMNFYSSHGYAVIKPDFRGNGFSIPNGIATSAYYSMDYNTDVMSLIAATKATKYLDKNNINLWGHSMGGYIALRAAVLSPDIKHLILLSAPVGTAEHMYTDYTPISDEDNPDASDIRTQELVSHGTPLSNPSYWDKTSPLSYLRGMKAKVEINVGSNDTIVPPQFSADLNNKLSALGIPHQYFIYKGGTHGLVAQRPQIWARSLKFLQSD